MTLPQIVFADPDWFFWAIDQGVFEKRGVALANEATDIAQKATNIRIPDSHGPNRVVEYIVHRPTGKFSHFDIVPADRLLHQGSSPAFRTKFIDLSTPRRIAPYDKLGGRAIIACLKEVVFGNASARMSQVRCEGFFDDPKNFV